jgi:hypothetical protein
MKEKIQLRFGDGTSQIPAARFYVLSNDRFMSGWGKARNMINTIVLPCRSYEEAEAVARYAKSREEQYRVRIVSRKPTLRRGVLYSVVEKPDDYSLWYSLSPDFRQQRQEG